MGKMKAGTVSNETSAQRMARDKRYNRGAALTLSIAKKYAAKKAVEKRKKQRQEAAAKKLQEKELERQRRAEERETARKQRELEKEQARIRKEKERHDKKVEQYLSRFDLECQKLDIFHDHNTAMECANEAIKASVSVAQISKYFIQGKEHSIHQTAVRSQFLNLLSEKLIVGVLEDYDSKEIDKVVTNLSAKKASELSDLTKIKDASNLLEKISKTEEEKKYWLDEQNKIDNFLKTVEENLSLLPEDQTSLLEYCSSETKLTLETVKTSKLYKEGLSRKDKIVKDVEKKFLSLVSE